MMDMRHLIFEKKYGRHVFSSTRWACCLGFVAVPGGCEEAGGGSEEGCRSVEKGGAGPEGEDSPDLTA